MELSCRVMNFGVPTPNGHVYTEKNFGDELTVYNECVKQGNAYGEVFERYNNKGYVEIAKITHRVKELNFDDKGIDVKIEILPSPLGNIISEMISSGSELYIEPRMNGSLKNKRKKNVNDASIISFDIVSQSGFDGATPLKKER